MDVERVLRAILPVASMFALGSMVACGPGKGEPTTTEATSGTTGATTSTTADGPGSLSHSATSASPPTSGPPVTSEPPTGTGEPLTSSTSGPVDPSTGTGPVDPATTSGAPGTTDTGGPGTTGGPGIDAYGPCQDSEPRCPGDQLCVELVEIPGAFCAPPCAPDMTCPTVDDGAMAVCALVADPMGFEPTHCVLVCDFMAPDPGCPAGSSCEEIPMQSVGICSHP